MLPANTKELIGRLDPGSFTAFVGGLLSAEAAVIGIPADMVVLSDAITDNDAGLDCLINNSTSTEESSRSAIPPGIGGFQFKATKKKSPSAFKLKSEVRKPGPLRVLRGSGTYILVSLLDLNPDQRRAVEAELASQANQALAEAGNPAEAKTKVWDAQTLAQLVERHPTVATAIGLNEFGAARSLPELLDATLQAEKRPFQADDAREVAVDRIRERARQASADCLLIQVHGDAGVGKTRAVAHALDTDGLRDLTLYMNGPEDLQRVLTAVIRNGQSGGILFVDEIGDAEAERAIAQISGVADRWRIVTVGSKPPVRTMTEGGRNVLLPPLSEEATKRLVMEYSSLPEVQAARVAEAAKGFPELAFRLAQELIAEPTLDLTRLARLPQPLALLGRAVSDEEVRRHLAPIALFAGVGFDGELRYQRDEVARAFDLEPEALERHCRNETGHFVSVAGRYWVISPLIVAVWLAVELFESTSRLAERISSLSEPLQKSFVQQLEFFGPSAANSYLPEALQHLIAGEEFRKPESFTEAAGRLLRASAAIIPAQVAQSIDELLTASTPEQLRELPRRELVWALQVLLWWGETWEAAIGGLYLLALNENETWSNNATGTFVDAFAVYLSGSTVPYGQRADWLMQRIRGTDDASLKLLAGAAAAGLRVLHSRTVVGFRGGGEPADWQPRTAEEYLEAQAAAWDALLEVRDRMAADDRLECTQELARSIRTMADAGQIDLVAASLTGRPWSLSERAALAAGIRDYARFAKLEADVPSAKELHDGLIGADTADRLEVLLRSPRWGLGFDADVTDDAPRLLVELADRLVDERDQEIALRSMEGDVQWDTACLLALLLAERLGWRQFGDAALDKRVWAGVVASLIVAERTGDEEWVDHVLRVVRDRYPSQAPDLLSRVRLTDDRLDLIFDLIEAGTADGQALGRLLFGARINEVDESRAIRLINAVHGAGQTESALALLTQWLKEHEPSGEIRALAGNLAMAAVTSGPSTMSEYYVKELVQKGALETDTLLLLWEARTEGLSAVGVELDQALAEKAMETPEAAEDVVLRMARGSAAPFRIAPSTAVLSVLAKATSPAHVWGLIQGWPRDDLLLALHCMDWGGEAPESLVRLYLLSDRLQETANEAAVCFWTTLGVVMGPYHLALERELGRARKWQADLSGTSAEWWAEELARSYEAQIPQHRLIEEEDNLRFR